MSYSIVPYTRFNKALKNPSEKTKYYLTVIELLKANDFDAIRNILKPHKLIGNYKGCSEYHIMPDLLIMRQDNAEKEIYLLDISFRIPRYSYK